MKDPFLIGISALSEGINELEWELNSGFFDGLNYSRIHQISGKVSCQVVKNGSGLELVLFVKAELVFPCDRCLQSLPVPVSNSQRVWIKQSEQKELDSEDIIIIGKYDHQINIKPVVYDMIHLSIPMRLVCDELSENQTCDQQVLQKLNTPDVSDSESDPRWEKLKKLKAN